MSMHTQDEISVTIRIMPKGEELEVELPLGMTGHEIINEIIDHGAAPKQDGEGNVYNYELISKQTNTKIENQTLQECHVKHGETLYLTPKLVAGSLDKLA